MRKTVIALSATAFAISSMVFIAGPATAAAKTTKMGCVVGKQTYSAMEGKCIAATPVKKAAKAAKAVKKAVKT